MHHNGIGKQFVFVWQFEVATKNLYLFCELVLHLESPYANYLSHPEQSSIFKKTSQRNRLPN